MFYDVMTRYKHKIALFCVSVTWCASAYNEDGLEGESWYTRLIIITLFNVILPRTSVPVTSIYCIPLVDDCRPPIHVSKYMAALEVQTREQSSDGHLFLA